MRYSSMVCGLSVLMLCLLSACRSPYVSRYDTVLANGQPVAVVKYNTVDATTFVLAVEQVCAVDSVKMRPEIAQVLAPVVAFAQRYKDLDMRIRVYGDDSMLSNKSINLEQYRAEMIAAYFWSQGIAAHRLHAKGHILGRGAVASNSYARGSWLNRRVEIAFYVPH